MKRYLTVILPKYSLLNILDDETAAQTAVLTTLTHDPLSVSVTVICQYKN